MEVLVRDVQGYEGLYKVTSQGEVISLKTGKPMKHWIPKDGYHRVKLYKSGAKQFQVHRLVATHFCGGCQEGLQVDHVDGDRGNNVYANLRWVTPTENVANTILRGTHNVTSAQEVAKIKNKIPVIAISPTGVRSYYDSAKDAGIDLKVCTSKITDVLKGRRQHTGGYKFLYQ